MQQRSWAHPGNAFDRVPGGLALVLLTLGIIAPFLNKAFHVDDPLFLWMADQIRRHPLDPYGFNVNWIGAPEPMWSAMQNPPLCSYFIAAATSVFGSGEIALHAVFLIWPLTAVLGVFALGRRASPSPLMAALLTLLTPVFVVSATNVMCDVMLLALYTWSIELWISGLENRNWSFFAASVLCASAAALTKYFGVSVVALLLAYTLSSKPRVWRSLFWLGLPMAVALVYDCWTRAKYGHPLFTGASHYAQMISGRYGKPWPKQFLVGCSFSGGCFLTILWFLQIKRWRAMARAFVVLAVSVTCFYFSFSGHNDFGDNLPFVVIEGGVFAAAGAMVLLFAFLEWWQQRDAISLLLFLWISGTFSFATFLNWSVTARTMLPMAPAVAILITRRVLRAQEFPRKRRMLILLAAGVSLAIACADYRTANTARTAAREFEERFGAEPGTVWFESHWGFQYYMQQWGARALNIFNADINTGDVMIIPANNTAVLNISPEKVYSPEEVKFSTVPFLTTIGLRTGACFYSSVRGPLPWMLGRVPPEVYYVARFR